MGIGFWTITSGQVTFGGVDYTKFQGNLTLVPNFSTQGFWEVQISKISVNGRSILTSRTAILDTGTTLIIAPPDDADAFHAAIPGAISDGQGGFTIPCNTKAKVSFTIGGKRFGILPMDLTVQPVDPNDLEGTCISGVSSGEIGGVNQWLVGDVFLKVRDLFCFIFQSTTWLSCVFEDEMADFVRILSHLHLNQNVYFATDVTNNQIGLAQMKKSGWWSLQSESIISTLNMEDCVHRRVRDVYMSEDAFFCFLYCIKCDLYIQSFFFLSFRFKLLLVVVVSLLLLTGTLDPFGLLRSSASCVERKW